MKDITSFLSDYDYKPEFSHVYVHEGYAVATDGIRLVEIKLDDFCSEHIKDGYYSPQKWKTMYKAYVKKNQDLMLFSRTILENALHADSLKDIKYPEYKNLISKLGGLKDFTPTVKLDFKYFVQFLEIAKNPINSYVKNSNNCIDFSKIKTDGKVIYFENDTTKMLLCVLDM